MISNNVFNFYSISISMQLFGNFTIHVPRYVWSFLAAIVMVVLSVVGQNSLYTILSDLVAIIGYWTIIYFAIFVEEHIIFRQTHFKTGGLGWDLTAWDDRHRLPKGWAAGFAFVCGAVGAIVGMGEAWYTG
jgi:purine-cytosine permease-like protein